MYILRHTCIWLKRKKGHWQTYQSFDFKFIYFTAIPRRQIFIFLMEKRFFTSQYSLTHHVHSQHSSSSSRGTRKKIMTTNKNCGYAEEEKKVVGIYVAHQFHMTSLCVRFLLCQYVDICKWERKANIATIKVMNESRSSVPKAAICLT